MEEQDPLRTGHGVQMTTHHPLPRKDRNDSYYVRAERASKLHDLLSRHHWEDGGVQMPTGDISKVEGWKGALRRPGTSLQCLLDCAVPPKQQWRSDLPDSVCLDADWSVILTRSKPLSIADDWSNSIVFWGTCFFLLVVETNRLETKMVLLHNQ